MPSIVGSIAGSVKEGFVNGFDQFGQSGFGGMLDSIKIGFNNAGTKVGTAFVEGLRNETQRGFIDNLSNIYSKSYDLEDDRNTDLDKLKADYNDTADGVIHNIINGCDLANESIDTVTESIDKQNLSWVKNGLKAVAANVGITLAITAVISVIGKAINAWKEARAAAHDAMTDYSDISTDTDTIIEEYKKLNDVISDNESTIDEVNAAKERMYELQQNVIDTYGNEAKGIDFVNGKYADQIRLVRKLQEEKANEYIRENRYHLNEIADNNSDTYAPVFEDSVNFEAANKNFLSYLEGISDRMDSFRLYKDGGSGLASIALDTTVLRGKEDLETLKGEFEKLLRYVENDFEKQFVENILDSIELAINKWEEDHEQDYNTGAIYGQALAESSNETIRHDGQILDVSDIYFDYADAIEAYNAALKSGVEEEIAVAEAKLNSMQGAVDKVISFAPTFELDEEQLDMFVLAFEKLQEEIDGATAKQRELKNELAAVWDGSDRAAQFDSTTTGMAPQYINKHDLESIKELKMTTLEFESLVKSDESSAMFKKLRAAADAAGVEIEDIISMLETLGLFADFESPISDEDIAEFQEYSNVIATYASTGEKYLTLTNEERAAIERWTAAANERNITYEEYLRLCNDEVNARVIQTGNELATAYNNLDSAVTDATNAMEDIDTIVAMVNGKLHLSTEEAAELADRHEGLASHLKYTTEGWILEADAMNVVESASNSLQTAFIAAQQAMSNALSGAAKARLEALGIELEGIQNIADAYRVIAEINGSNGPVKVGNESLSPMKPLSGVGVTEMFGIVNNAASGKLNAAEQQTIINYGRIAESLSKNKALMDNLTTKLGQVSSGSGSKVEKYLADIDELYKALEKQKEIEEDIADIQRKRNGLEEDDYTGQIKSIYAEIDALGRLNNVLHEQNEIRRDGIRAAIARLQQYGFLITYDSAQNELLIQNYNQLNEIATAFAKRAGYGAEKTNEFVKDVEDLVNAVHELNDANKENSATWQDNTQAIKDYIKEIKALKTEMVDDYLDKKENYLSHMQDFELWDAAKTVEYLEEMLHDLEDFYNAGLIDYEKFVEEYQAITKRIYDSRKDSLEYILDMVEDMIRQELEDQVDAYEEQKDALNDIIDAKKKIIQLAKEENDYNKSLEDKIKEMARLQERIAQLELDDSREASAEKAGLIEQLAELQSEVDSMQYDKSIEMQENALDEMGEANEKAIDKEIEQLEDLANNAEYIHDKTIEYIRENWDSLLSDLISYNNMYGDGIDENVTQNWENAKSALQEYRDAAWEVAKEMTTGQAVHGTVNEFMPVVGDTAQSVIAEANKAEISNIVSQMKAYAAQWSKASSSDVKADLANKAQQKAMELPSLGVEAWRNPTTGEWIIMRDDNNPSNVGQLLYDKYHTGGTVGELKNNELFALLEKGEDVLTEQQQRIAVPLLKAGIDMLNLSEGARSVFEFIKNMATPNLSMLRDSNESLVYAPEVNVTVTSNGGDADEIANAVKDRVLDAINGTFNKMGVSSKFKSIRV